MDAETIHLQVRGADRPPKEFDMEPGVYTVGADRDNKIVLRGSGVAWKHAILSFFSDGLWVEDLGSETGTHVDGQRVDGRCALEPGQQVSIGSYHLVVGAADPVPPTAPPQEAERRFPTLPEDTESERRASDRIYVDKKHTIKGQIQKELMNRLDIPRLTASHVSEADLHDRVHVTLEHIIAEAGPNIPADVAPEDLLKEVYDETVRLGPLEDLIADPDITEIMVNGHTHVYIEKAGKLELTDRTFMDDNSVLAIIERIVAPIGRRIDESQPYVDARLQDGSRVNAIIPPLSLTGPCLTIRKFSKEPLTVQNLVDYGTLTLNVADFIRASVVMGKNIVVSGGTGSGKTTLLNVISSYIPSTERIVTIEDAAELRLSQEHVIRLEARPPNIEGRGAITIRDLVRNALRMRPDRIVVGECRGGEALDMLQAMNTGHEGSLTTVHANSPRDVMSRLETMVLMSGMELPVRAIREQVGSAIHMVVHIARFSDGTRKVAQISEVVGLEGDRITMQDIFKFNQTGVSPEGRILGSFLPTGSVPTFVEEMKVRGISIDHKIFDPDATYDL